MSSFHFVAANKKTGEKIEVFAHDDHFGPHEYGYRLPNNQVLTEDEFYQQYMRVNATKEEPKKPTLEKLLENKRHLEFGLPGLNVRIGIFEDTKNLGVLGCLLQSLLNEIEYTKTCLEAVSRELAELKKAQIKEVNAISPPQSRAIND